MARPSKRQTFDAESLNALDEHAVSAARFSVNALVTICAATLLLVSSAEPKNMYRDAIAELTTLLDLDYQGFLSAIALRDNEILQRVDKIRAILAEVGLSLSVSHGNVIVVEPNSRETLWSVRGGSKLERVDRNFIDTTQLNGEVIDVSAVEDAFRTALHRMRDRMPADVKAVSLEFSRGGDDTELTLQWGFGQTHGQVVREKMGAPHTSQDFSLPLNIFLEFSRSSETQHLVRVSSTGFEFLPNTKLDWDKVRDASATQARAILAQEDDPPEKSLEVFGLSVPERRVSWLAPLLICGISMYVLIYTRRLAQVVRDKPALADYPWVHLMRGPLSFAVSIVLIGLLPLTALAWTLAQTWDSTGAALKLVSIAASIGASVALGFALRELPPVRSGIRAILARISSLQSST